MKMEADAAWSTPQQGTQTAGTVQDSGVSRACSLVSGSLGMPAALSGWKVRRFD
jgi:hypothetical protein